MGYQRGPGWQINGIFSAYQGRPYTLTASGAALNMPGNLQTPDQIKPTVEKLGKVGDDGTWLARISHGAAARWSRTGSEAVLHRPDSAVVSELRLFA